VALVKALCAVAPDKLTAIKLDVTQAIDIEQAAQRCNDVNLLVNNAGVFNRQSLMNAPDLEAMRNEMEVNYIAPVALTRAFLPCLENAESAAVINVLSAGGIVSVPEMGG